MQFGEQLRQARLKKGFSQENMADLLHLSTTAYGDIERNKTEITISRLIKICEILEIDPNSFLGNSSETYYKTDEIEKLKAEILLAKIEASHWKERFYRAMFSPEKIDSERKRIGFK